LWFGLYATWQGIILQIAAAAFVLGSYFGAEWLQSRKRAQLRHRPNFNAG
jgi:high-affinity iron transporter